MKRTQLHRLEALPIRCSPRSAASACAWRLRQLRRIAAADAPTRLANVGRLGATMSLLTQTAPALLCSRARPSKSP
jgi:hypothetical protein